VRTPETEEVAQRTWSQREPDEARTLDVGVTLFNSSATCEASLLSVLETVELHHGERSQDPPVSIIEVLGTEPSEPIREAFAALGFVELLTTDLEFSARRRAIVPYWAA
jgi:hypothetical protein